MPRLLTRSGLSKYLGISQFSIRNWLAKGIIKPTVRTPGGRNLFSLADAESIRDDMRVK